MHSTLFTVDNVLEPNLLGCLDYHGSTGKENKVIKVRMSQLSSSWLKEADKTW